MKTASKIMVACDFSEYALQILAYAVALARRLNADLHVVNVINQRDVEAVRKVAAEYPAFSEEKYLDQQKGLRLEMMDRLIAQAEGGDLDIRKMVNVGVPYRAILQALEEVGADMLIMGTHGRGPFTGALFGSTAEKVFRRCPVPVVSIRYAK